MVQFLIILGIIALTVIAYVIVKRSQKTQECCVDHSPELEPATWVWEPVKSSVEETTPAPVFVEEPAVEEESVVVAPKAKKTAKAKAAPKTKAAKAKTATKASTKASAKSTSKTEGVKRGRKPKNGGDSLLLS
jgi:hypothetical protein